MEENEKTQEQLLEEQLQAVTGGCENCVRDRISAARLLETSARHEALSLQPGLRPEDRQTFKDGVTHAHRNAQALLDRVVARHHEINDSDIPLLPESFVRPPEGR